MPVSAFKRHAARAVGVAVVFAGLTSATPGAEYGASQSFELDLGDYRFSPATIEVTVGKPVERVLTDRDTITPHNRTLSAPGAGIDSSVDVQPGKTVSVLFTPTKAGSYAFYCDKKLIFAKSHRERGMEGKLVVKAP